MSILVLLAVLVTAPVSPELVIQGRHIQLTPVAEPVVVRSSDLSRVESMAFGAGGHMIRALRNLAVISGAAYVAPHLAAQGDEVLAVFETERGERLIADAQVRVQFKPGVSSSRALNAIAAAGGSAPRLVSSIYNEYALLAPSPEAALDVGHALRDSGLTVWADPDFIMQAHMEFVPNDPLYTQQWHHDILDSGQAWDISQGSPTMTIAILDSGTDMQHPDLAAKLVSPRDELQDIDDATPAGNDAHGTACSGIAAALTNNATGIAGVCPQCTLMPIRVLDQSGFSRVSSAADGIRWAAQHGARILSNSWSLTPPPDELLTALEQADASGLLIFFASGNEAVPIQDGSLASSSHVHAIGATDEYDLLASYSNFGSQQFVTAPAASVTTDISDQHGFTSGAYYAAFAGTSAATPVAAGVAGLIWSLRPEMTSQQVADIMSSTADHIGTDIYVNGRNDTYGYGRLNAYRALQMAANLTACAPVAEICDDGKDNDCDGLIDGLDPQCAPAQVSVGVACTHDFQCSDQGLCLGDDLGFPDGYCTVPCDGRGGKCPSGSVCIGEGYTTGSSCYLSCSNDTDCRSGYQCLPIAGNPAGGTVCVPSCNLSSCLAGETCNTSTGVCEHNGPSPNGGACTIRTDCADNGRCLPDDIGFHDGYCVTECQDTRQCPDGTLCLDFGSGTAFCLASCEQASDCREFYACHSISDAQGSTFGYCWQACLSSSDCGNQTCNTYGLCGNDHPPKQAAPSTQPKAESDASSGCAALADDAWSALLCGLWLLRRKGWKGWTV